MFAGWHAAASRATFLLEDIPAGSAPAAMLAALKTLTQQYKFYHRYARLTRITIAAGANFSLGGLPNVGAHFDPGKLAEYRREVRSRVSFAKVLPNFVKGCSP